MDARSDLEAGTPTTAAPASDVRPMQERALAEFEARHGARQTLESLRPKGSNSRLHKVAPAPAPDIEDGAAFCPICFTELVVRQSTTIATAVSPGRAVGSPAVASSSAEAAVEALHTACGHQFCEPCLVQLADRSSACPLCRAPIHDCDRKRPAECELCAAGVRRAGERSTPPPRPLHVKAMFVISGALALGSLATCAVSLLGNGHGAWNVMLLGAWSAFFAVSGMWAVAHTFLEHRLVVSARLRVCVHAFFCLGSPPLCVGIFVFFWMCLVLIGMWD